MEEQNLVGRWAVCSKGRIGRIEGRQVLTWGLSWVGKGLDGRPWASQEPVLIAESDAGRLEEATSARTMAD